MKNTLKSIISDQKEKERQYAIQRQAEIDHIDTKANRRDFLKKTALGGMSLTALMGLSFEDSMAQTTSKVQKASAPSDLKITDLRYCVTTVLGRTAIIRIDTNQGIYGLGGGGVCHPSSGTEGSSNSQSTPKSGSSNWSRGRINRSACT